MLIATVCLPGQAAEKPSASYRAYLYQREARRVLEHHLWRVALDTSGKLVACKGLPSNSLAARVATLTLIFKADSSSHTTCTANIVSDIYWRDQGGSRKAFKTQPYNTPETTKEIQDMIAEAENGLIAIHPEYAKR